MKLRLAADGMFFYWCSYDVTQRVVDDWYYWEDNFNQLAYIKDFD